MRTVELFCGAGGMALGLTRAGMRIYRAYDNWRPALKVHRVNLERVQAEQPKSWLAALSSRDPEFDEDIPPTPPHTYVGDLGDLTGAIPEIIRLEPDVLCGGPPCQAFSRVKQGKKRRVEGKLAAMTTGFAIIAATARPRYFIMENVEDMLKSKAWARARIVFKKAGYGLTVRVLDASLYGSATARERVLVIGCLDEVDGFLDEHLDAAASPTREARPLSPPRSHPVP